MPSTRLVIACAAAALLAAAALSAEDLDSGLLDMSWFPGVGELRETRAFDYLWVRDGFSFDGRTVRVGEWEGPAWLGKERDVKDRAKAEELTELMPVRLRGALKAALETRGSISKEDGDMVLVGRFVDVNAGSKAAKWIVGMGAGSAAATWDLKFEDAETGELLVAIHHRVISGTHMSEIDDKIRAWLEKLAGAAAEDFAEYGSGKVRSK